MHVPQWEDFRNLIAFDYSSQPYSDCHDNETDSEYWVELTDDLVYKKEGCNEEVDEDDMLKNRPHNNHVAEGDEEDVDEAEDDLDEEEVDKINESAMAAWVKRASMIY